MLTCGLWTEANTLQLILPMEDEVEDLLTCKTAEPSALRFPSKGSTIAASSGSISTLNLLCASYIWKQGEQPSTIMASVSFGGEEEWERTFEKW